MQNQNFDQDFCQCVVMLECNVCCGCMMVVIMFVLGVLLVLIGIMVVQLEVLIVLEICMYKFIVVDSEGCICVQIVEDFVDYKCNVCVVGLIIYDIIGYECGGIGMMVDGSVVVVLDVLYGVGYRMCDCVGIKVGLDGLVMIVIIFNVGQFFVGLFFKGEEGCLELLCSDVVVDQIMMWVIM